MGWWVKPNMATSVKTSWHGAQALGLDRLDAQILLLHVLQKPTHDRAWLLSHDTDEITSVQQQSFDQLVRRRLGGEPVAYLVGSKAFFGLNFNVDARVLVPRPDTECLVEWALACIATTATPDVLDLGTGSGAIGLAIKHNCSNANVTLVDASQAALDVALGNAASLSLAGVGLRGLQSNWFERVPATDRFDLIVSNPPYIADGDSHLAALGHEPLMALTSGADGLDAIRQIIDTAPRYLKPGAWLLLEHGYDQATAVRALLLAQGFERVVSRRDLNGIERCSGGTLKSDF
jgi:release factor glutamine methyltransferase